MSTPRVKFEYEHTPNDETLKALGLVSIRHGFLDVILKRAVKQLAGITVEEADRALVHTGSRALRELVNDFARKTLGKASAARLQVAALMQECSEVTDRRNELTHDIWIEDEDGVTSLVGVGKGTSRPLPTAADVMALAERIAELTERLIEARSTGFIAQALLERTVKS